MQRLKWFKPSSRFRNAKNISTTHRPRTRPPPLMEQLRFLIDKEPHRSPLGVTLRRFKQVYPKGIAPLSEYTSLFDCFVQLNRTRDAKMVYMTMRDAGYTTSVSVEAKVVIMLLEEFGSEDSAQQREVTEHLASLVQDKNFTEKDMYEIWRLAAARDIDKKVVWFAMDAFRSARGAGNKYIPALNLLPVAVEAAVRRGAVEEAFAMLDEAGVAIKKESAMTEVASRRVPRELSIRRDLGIVDFKSRPAAQKSLRFAYGSLLTSLRDTGVWKTDIHVVQRALQGLEAAGVDPDTVLLNLAMVQAIHTKLYTKVLPIYQDMRKHGLRRGQWPDGQTYDALFTLWEALRAKPTLHAAFHAIAPRTLFCNLLEATDPLYVKNISVSASTTDHHDKSVAKPLILKEELLRRVLGAFLFQEDYAGAYVALTYMTSKAAGITIKSWHAVYYIVVRHLVQRIFAQLPGPYGRARWTEGFLGIPLRSDKPLYKGYRSAIDSHKPIEGVKLPLNAQTTNYMLAVIARRKWSITDPLYPPPGELPEDSTHLFSPLAAAAAPGPGSTELDPTSSHPAATNKSKRHDFEYSVPSMFMMEHVDPPDLPPGFAWAIEPLQRLLLRALYADEIFAYRVVGRSAGLADRPLEMPPDEIEECTLNVERKLLQARDHMLPLLRQRSAVPIRLK